MHPDTVASPGSSVTDLIFSFHQLPTNEQDPDTHLTILHVDVLFSLVEHCAGRNASR